MPTATKMDEQHELPFEGEIEVKSRGEEDLITWQDLFASRNKLWQDKSPEFHRLFGKQLSRFTHPVFGFDIVKLDEELHGSIYYTGTAYEGMSMAQRIEAERGEEAAQLIQELLIGEGVDNANTED